MATLKQRLHRKNVNGGYDVIHLETSASVVMRADGSTSVEQSLTEIESWDLLKYEEAGDYAGMPYMEDDASTLQGHPVSDFILAENADFAPSVHNHTKSQITDFSHSHTKSEISDFAHTHSKMEITDFPTTMTPTAHNHTASEITSGTLPVAQGGTGKASWTANRLMYPSASTTMAQLAFPSVAGSVLRQGTSGAPYWTSLADLKTSLNIPTVKINYFDISVSATTDDKRTGKTTTITPEGNIIAILLSTVYYAGGSSVGSSEDINFRLAVPVGLTDSQYDYYHPLSNIILSGSNVDLATLAIGTSSSGYCGIGPAYDNNTSWNCGNISVTESLITVKAWPAEGSSSSGRTTGTLYVSGIYLYS